MFKCEDCNSIFETPDSKEDFVGHYGSAPAYQTIGVCPDCGSDEISEVDCDEEGILNEVEIEEYNPKSDVIYYSTYNSEWYYENCRDKCDKCIFYNKKHNYCKWKA